MSETIILGPLAGKMRAWVAPDVDTPWYPIAAMRWAGLPVVVMLEKGGVAVLAVARKQTRPKGVWWYQLGSWCKEEYRWLKHDEIRLAPYGQSPPAPNSPVAFRPVDPERWPHPLPAALDRAMGQNRPELEDRSAPEGVDPHQGSPDACLRQDDPEARLRQDDDWPHFGVRLTLGVPASLKECEARILRAFRTSNAQARVGHGAGSFCNDIPSDMVKIALMTAAREREMEERREGKAPALDAVRSGWTPSERDLEDWWFALDWLNGLDRRSLKIVQLRAADPPWSFRQIKEKVRMKCHKTVRVHYERAIAAAFATAQMNGGGT